MAETTERTKSKRQLIEELQGLRQQVAELQQSNKLRGWAEGTSQETGHRVERVDQDAREGAGQDVAAPTQAEAEVLKLNRELGALSSIGQALISTLGLEETLDIITDKVTQLMGVEAASVILHDEAKGDLWFAAASGEGAGFIRSVRLRMGQGIAGWVAQQGEPVIVPDVSKDTRWFQEFDKGSGLTTHSILCVPLQTRGRTIGAIEVMNKERGTFGQEDVRLLTSLAALAATAIETARLHDRAQREIIERSLVEGELRESEERLRTVLDFTPSGILVIDAETHRIVDANPAALEMIGLPPEQVIGSVCHDHVCPAVEGCCPITDLGQSVDHSERILLDADGREVPILKSVTTVMLSGREHLLESFVDITERKRTENALRESEEKYRAVLENIEEGYFEVDLAGNFTFFNDALCDFLGYTADEMLGKNNREYMSEDSARNVYQVFNNVYRTGASAQVLDWEVVRKDGTTGHVESSVSLMRDVRGTPVGFRGIVRDITGQRQAQAEREQLLTTLERRSTQLQTAAEVSRAVSSILNPEALAPQVVDLVRERFGLYYAGLFLVDHTGEWTGEPHKWAVLRAGTGEAGRQMMEQGHKLEIGGTSMIGWCIANKQARIALDVGEDAIRFENPYLPETRSELALPLVNRGRPIGALTIQSSQEAAFSREDITVLQTMADQLANAIANAQLYEQAQREIRERRRAEEETRRRSTQAALVYEVGQRVSGELELERLLSEIVTAVRGAFDYYGVMLLLVDEETHRLVLQAAAGGHTGTFPQDFSLAIGEAIIGRAAATGESQISGDVGRDPHYVSMASGEAKSELAVPIKSGRKTIGVLDLQSNKFNAFDNTDAMVMETLADQIAAAIENAHLYEETQQRLREQTMLFNASRRLAGASLRPEEIAEVTVRQLAELMGEIECSFSVPDPQGEEDTLQILADLSIEGEVEHWKKDELPFSLSDYPATARVMETLQPLVVQASDPHADPAELAYMQRSGVATLAIVPLALKGQAIGVIELETKGERHYTPGQLNMAMTLANQAAVALESARLYEAMQQELAERRRIEGVLQQAHEDLERYTHSLERQTAQLQVGAEVAREAAGILDVQRLLDTAVRLISDRFGFYHAGVFLVDDQGEYAVMRAASSEGGQRMLARGHRLLVGKVGIVGHVAATGEPRIALDVGEDAVHFAHADLPDTRSEMGLPLKVRGRTIGVLDVQDTQEAAFSDDDVAALQTLADQLAVAIDNARLVERTETQLRELSLLHGEYSTYTAAELASAERSLGYVYDRIDVMPAERIPAPALDMALTHGKTVALVEPETTERTLATPLKLHDQVIGSLGIQETDGGRGWSPNEIALIEAVSEQVALALENAQHFAETQKSAHQRQVLNELAQALATNLTVEAVMRETYQGASRLLDTTNFYIALYDPEADSLSFPLVSENGQRVHWQSRQAGDGLSEYVIRNRRPILIRENLSEQLEELGIEMIGAPALSWLGVPLTIGDRVLGVIAVQSHTTPRAYDVHHQDLLMAIASQTAIALQNAHLFEEARVRAEELAALNELSQALTGRLTVDEVMEETYRGASRLLDTTNFSIGLYDSDKDEIAFYFDTSKSETGRQTTATPAGQSISGYVIRNRAGVLIRENVSQWLAETGVALIGELPASWMGVPLVVGDRVLGLMSVQSFTTSGAYDEHDCDLLTAIASQTAIALQNAYLFEETRAALAETQALYLVGEAISRLRDVEEIFRTLAQVLVQQLGYTGAWLALVDDRTQTLRGVAGAGVSMAEDIRLERISLDPQASNPAVQAVLRREPIVINDALIDEQITDAAIGVRSGMERVAEIPILVGNEAAGVLAVNRPAGSPKITERDLEVLGAVADQAAVALQNIRLLEQARRRAAQLAAASEVARDATSILEVDQLLDETVHLISEQFNYYHAGVFLLDEKGEYAVLRAGSSEGGRRMLARGHKLLVGKVGIVGYVSATGKPRIALDVGKDAMHFVNPDLPDTRSEMGLPLKVRDQVIGVLDVQSTEEAAFSDEDVATLQTLADQLAAAIVNARLFNEVRTDAMRRALINDVQQAAVASLDPDELLHQAGEVISRRLSRCSVVFVWESRGRNLRPVAAHDQQGDDIRLPDGLWVTRRTNPTLFSDVVDGRSISILDTDTSYVGQLSTAVAERMGIQAGVYVPLVARDQVLGVLAIDQPEGDSWEELDFIEIISTNLSVALEGARLYQEAVETAEKLQEMDRLKSQFLANMSHELRTPLNSIIGFSRVILKGIDGPLTDMQRTDLEAVYNSGQHLLELINSILDISKIQAGKMELSFEDTDLKDIIKVVMSTAIALVKDKPIELQQSVPQDLPNIRADSRRIRQVLLNLVGNAAKFTEEGFIRVEAGANPIEVIISVTDSGVGIPEDKQESIFEEFTQVDGSSTRAVGGTGLGLSISRHFVEMHGGRIWVESTEDVGSAFYIALPIAGPSERAEEVKETVKVETELESEPEPKERTEPAQKVVLCVDDDEGVITLFRRYLSKQGYQVVGFSDSMGVVEKAQQLKPFAITLDVMMPEKDGWQIIQELKANPATHNIPVIICTIVADKDQGISLGASDYLVKPILEDDLIAALERLDRQSRDHNKVLIVDDHAEDRKLLRRMIESQEGYEVLEATGGQEAIALIRERQPNVIILDLMMPDVDGFAVLESIKADKTTRSIPVVVVTAKTLSQKERDTLNQRVEALLEKGIFEQQELLADVAAALDRLRTTGDRRARTTGE